MRMKIFKVLILTLSITNLLFANEELEKTMKDLRLGYKELRDSIKSGSMEDIKRRAEDFITIVNKLEKIKMEEQQEVYNRSFKKFKEANDELWSAITAGKSDNFKEKLAGVRKSCNSCHKEIMSPIKRFFVELTF